MSYIQPKNDYKDGDILYGIDLNASNEVIKAGVDDNFDRIQGLEESKQDTIDSSNKLDYSLLDNTPTIPSKTSDLTNDSGFIDDTYHDDTKQDVLTAGEGIDITDNVISNTQTSAEWGNITGTLSDQTDLNNALGDKQDVLVSGTTIKTINNQSILGSGNISVGGGSGGTSDYDQLENRPQINNVTLTGNKSLSDLGINIPTKISDLTNDNNTVTDASYVHTDNNYTSAEKTKLSNIESGAEVNDIDTIKVNGTSQTINNKAVDITVPTKLSDLNNDNNTVTDASYVHTDNNYTTIEKTKLSGIEAGAQVNVNEVLVNDTPTEDTVLLIDDFDLELNNDILLENLPVGTEVDFTGDVSDIPAGWEQVDDYSTTEVNTGKTWIDGSPIYRKVFTGNWDGTGEKAISLGTNDILHNVYGFCNDGTYKRPLNSNWSQVQALSMIFTNNQILITQSGAVQPVSYVNYEIVAEYTKSS